MIQKWETIKVKKYGNLKIFDVDIVTRKHPEWDKESDFVVLDSPRWVNIIPITKDNNIVLIEQYRHGLDSITIEVPGGLVERHETPLQAGMRECTEETGYISDKPSELLGISMPNPAFLNNLCYSYVWFGCEKLTTQKLDNNEDIEVKEVPSSEIKHFIKSGKISHSLVLTAFFYYFLKYDN